MATNPTDKYLQFRGEPRALLGSGSRLLVATVHPEGHATALYTIELDRDALTSAPLPAGATHLVGDEDAVFVSGSDGRVYRGKRDGSGKLSALVEGLEPAPGALALVSEGRLAVASGRRVLLVDRKKGAATQPAFELAEEVTALAADESGQWLVAGTQRGLVVVFDGEAKAAFVEGESAKLHEGAVTALCFDPDELRVISAGTDQKLLQTFVRGALAAEDRGRGGMHEAAATAILVGPAERIYSTSSDATIKQWPIGRGTRPATQKDGAGRGVALALVELNGRPHLAQACDDATVRIFTMDAAGTLGECVKRLHDVYAWAGRELATREPPQREAALRALAQLNDRRSIEMITAAAGSDADAPLRVVATELLGASGNDRARQPLEGLLRSPTEGVRLAALAGLRRFEGERALGPLERALASGQENVGIAAVEALAGLSRSDDEALVRLIGALDHDARAVRLAALDGLTGLHPAGSPEPELVALRSSRADVRREALVRCFRRGLLELEVVRMALRRHAEDRDADVRLTAFLVSLASRPRLAATLRSRDRNVHRLLGELEGVEVASPTGADASEGPAPKTKRKSKKDAASSDGGARLQAAGAVEPSALTAEELAPLLEAMASRALDTCVRGAGALAELGDGRAFGTLLQLSRDQDKTARVEACKALEVLGDERAVQRLRLMLRDAAAEVRDAAFTALAKLLGEQPLEAAEAGLMAEHEDVRRRGLQALVGQLRQGGKKKDVPVVLAEGAPAAELLRRALNDQVGTVRSEAFKAVLNLRLGGAGSEPLRFALQSIHGDVRREVLVEVMGRIAESWAWPLLLELFDDPDSSLRQEAFDFALSRARNAPLEPLRAALTSRYADLRVKATEALSRRREDGATLLLVRALEDDDNVVRQLAVDALVTAGVQSALEQAMQSEWSNVRVRAACARAAFGDPAALEPLLAQATAERPTFADERALWQQYVLLALSGLAELGSAAAIAPLLRLLEAEEPMIRAVAARTLAWCVEPSHSAALRAALQHEDWNVKYYAAVGLAFLGDPSGASFIFAFVEKARSQTRQVRRKGNEVEPDDTWMALLASLALPGDDLLLSFLDHPMADIHQRALILVLLLELASDRANPRHLLAAMSSAHPGTRLLAARALELWPSVEGFDAFVVGVVNDRGDHVEPGTLALDDVRDLAATVTHGQGHVRMRFATLLWNLTVIDDETGSLRRALDRLRGRYGAELRAAVAARPSVVSSSSRADFGELVLGAYIGLSRHPGGRGSEAIRSSALRMLVAQASDGKLDAAARKVRAEAALPALLQGVRDQVALVREAAFAGLIALDVDRATVSAEALASGHRDMGVRGLQLLTEQAGAADARRVLEEVMLRHTDGLEFEALRLLTERADVDNVEVLSKALEASAEGTRLGAVEHLAPLYKSNPRAAAVLREALASRYKAVRYRAAQKLAYFKDPACLEVLREQLAEASVGDQRTAAWQLQVTGDARAAEILVARLEHDPAGTADASSLLGYVGNLRSPAIVGRLVPWLKETRTRWVAFNAALTSTGFDQWLPNGEDDDLDPKQEAEQHPRHTAALAELIEAVYPLADTYMLGRLVPQARGARGSEVDVPLSALSRFPDDGVRNAALEALGWRARKRAAPIEPLLAALAYPEPTSQFLAAEGLALVGRREGVGVLLTSAEMLDDDALRARAVAALGKLADERALDLLLRLAEDDSQGEVHEAAVEAIGHLARSPRGEDILGRLEAASRSDDGELAAAAIRGLRWFGSARAWAAIRAQAGSEDYPVRLEVAQALAHDPDAAGLDLLRRLVIEDDDEEVAAAAVRSLRKLLGRDTLEVDYLLVQGPQQDLEPDTVERLRTRGEPARLFELLAKVHEDMTEVFVPALCDALLSREPLPLAEAAAALASPDVRTRSVAAQVVGRAGAPAKKDAASKRLAEQLVAATQTARAEWHTLRGRISEEQAAHSVALTAQTRLWARLVWACGRLGAGADEILSAARLAPEQRAAQLVRCEAMTALSAGAGGADGLATLEAATGDADAAVRETAAAGLRLLDAKRAAAAVPRVLDDRASLDQLLDRDNQAAAAALSEAAHSVHYQGVALPHLIALGDVEHLGRAARDGALSEATRTGALEALARIDDRRADEALLAVARDEDEVPGLRKTAWRALRRLKRLRTRVAAPLAPVG